MHDVNMNKARTTLYVDKTLYDKLKSEAEERGISINTLVADILANYLYEKELKHFNCYENHVTIWDGRMHRLIDVYLIPNDKKVNPYCEVCLSSKCPHAELTRKLPKVKQRLAEKGLELG